MRMNRVWALAILAAVLNGCAAAKDRYLEDGYRPMSGGEIVEIFAGQTVEGRYGDGGGTFIEFRAADGRLTTTEPSGKNYQGRWEVDGDLLCFTYPTGGDPTARCVDVLVKDGKYAEFRTSGPTLGKIGAEITSIQPGNVKNLPLE